MKIYMSSRNKTDEVTLASFIGKDIWVKVYNKTGVQDPKYANRYIHLFKNIIGIGYHSINAYFIDNYDEQAFHTQCFMATNGESYTNIDAIIPYALSLNDYFYGNPMTNKFRLLTPVETYTTDELFDIIKTRYGHLCNGV